MTQFLRHLIRFFSIDLTLPEAHFDWSQVIFVSQIMSEHSLLASFNHINYLTLVLFITPVVRILLVQGAEAPPPPMSFLKWPPNRWADRVEILHNL